MDDELRAGLFGVGMGLFIAVGIMPMIIGTDKNDAVLECWGVLFLIAFSITVITVCWPKPPKPQKSRDESGFPNKW